MNDFFDEYTDAMNTVQKKISLLCGKNEEINFGGHSVGKIKDFSDEIDSGNFKLTLPAGKDMSTTDVYDSNIRRFLEMKHQSIITDINKKSPENVVSSLIEYASTLRIVVPEKTQERWKELINSGEKVENIKNYIDNYSMSIGLQEDSIAPLKKEPVVGKELADFMTDVYEEFHSGGEKNMKQERGMDI